MLQVDDESTSVLMEQMYGHLMDGRTTVAQALRLAMLHLLRRPPSSDWRRPKYWAGFLVVGATTRLRCTTHVEGWREAVAKKLKELGLKMGNRIKLQHRIEELQTQNLPRTLSTAPGGAGPRSLAFRCTAPSAHPPQVMLRGWEYDRLLLLSIPSPLPRSDARSFPPSLSISPSLSLRVCVCVRAFVRACVPKARCH